MTFLVHASCNPNIFGENFKIVSIHKSQIFGNFHQALSPIIGGPAISAQLLTDPEQIVTGSRDNVCSARSTKKEMFGGTSDSAHSRHATNKKSLHIVTNLPI